jgi:hypothetical protein
MKKISMSFLSVVPVMGLASLALLLGSAASADTVTILPPGTATSPGILPSSVTYVNGSAQVQGSPGTAGGGIDVSSLASGTYAYAQTFNSPLATFTPPGGSGSYAFYTDYVFTVAPGQVDSITSSINLGTSLAVNGLSARLYSYSAGSTSNTLLPAFTPTGTIIDAWSSQVNLAPGLTASDTVIAPTDLGAGTYVLEIRATSVGTSGGSYSGTLNIAPVPLPAGLPLLLSATVGLGFGFFRGARKQRG